MRNIIKQVLKEEFDSKSERVKSIVNKYGIDRSIELVVGGVDTIRQAYEDNPLEFLNQFNDLTSFEKNSIIFYVDKDRLTLFMYHSNEKNRYVYIDYDRIWKFFEVIIGIEYDEIQTIINNWLENTYNLKGLTPAGNIYVNQTYVGSAI